jgi:hypothetical protein
MRLMMRFTIPVERGNQAFADHTIGEAIEALVKATNAEAAYFATINGKRAGFIEPMFAALNASIDTTPALTLEDLKRGLAQD